MAVGDSLVPMAYHTYGTDVFEVPGCDARYNYYGGGGTPQVWFDGTIRHLGGNHTNPINYWPYFNQRKVVDSPVTMSIELQGYNPRNGMGIVRAKVTNVSDSDVTGCIHLNTTGDDTAYTWQNMTHLYYTVLEVDFGDNTCFILAPGEVAEVVDQVFTLNPGWRDRSCTVVGFFQDPGNRHIHQGALLHGITNSLSEEVADGQILLNWAPVYMASEYWVFGEQNNPHFVPDLGLNFVNRVAVVPGQSSEWSTTEGINNPDANWTYLVIAANPQNQVMWQSDRLGEYEFSTTITPR
jgi:hypothetical protein